MIGPSGDVDEYRGGFHQPNFARLPIIFSESGRQFRMAMGYHVRRG